VKISFYVNHFQNLMTYVKESKFYSSLAQNKKISLAVAAIFSLLALSYVIYCKKFKASHQNKKSDGIINENAKTKTETAQNLTPPLTPLEKNTKDSTTDHLPKVQSPTPKREISKTEVIESETEVIQSDTFQSKTTENLPLLTLGKFIEGKDQGAITEFKRITNR
jgi:hypothetical protein